MPKFVQNPLNQFESEQLPSGWPSRFFSVSLVIFSAVFLGYLGLVFGYEPFLRSKIEDQDQAINQLVGAISKEEQEKFTNAYSKIINLKNLLDKHVKSSKIFPLLGQITNKKVVYTGANLKVPEKELELEGIADSYNSLAEQLESFNQTEAVSRYLLNQSQLTSGAVQFKATLKLKDTVLK